jgi:hypothetical protein
VTQGGSILQYRALDARGEELLDEVEREIGIGPRQMENGIREYFLPTPGSGEKGIEPLLEQLDRGWDSHIDRVTSRH